MDDGRITLEEFHLVGNRIEARFALDAAKEIAGCFLALCDEHGAQNYLEMQMHDKSGRGVTVTVRRIEGKTPHQLRQEADAKVAALTAELEALRRDAAQDKARLDWLEHMANKSSGLLLHDGSEKGRCGLGLRPGFLSRTLREAIDDSAGFDAARQQEAARADK